MKISHIDSVKIIFFDLMDTLMFAGNRFADDQNYAATYRQAGGSFHSDHEAQNVLQTVFNIMQSDYSRPDCYDNFRHVRNYLYETLPQLNLPTTDVDCLADTFAQHELGHLPESHCATLHRLRQTHRLGLVSNLWSGKERFVDAFRNAGVLDLFDTLVFSSDYGCIKPSPRLFNEALNSLGAAPHEVLFVGDDWERDVLATRALGMSAVWVNRDGSEANRPGPQIRSVVELLE